MSQGFDLSAYCRRVGLSGDLEADEESLKRICQAQILTIPFENFNIHLGRPVLLDTAALTKKLIVNRRGGFCFELNGLLTLALQAVGFEVRPLLGRVHLRGEHLGRTHQLCLVTLNGQHWIADVGFGGGGLTMPALLVYNEPMHQSDQPLRFVQHAAYGTMLQVLFKDDQTGETFWKDIYSFDDQIVEAGDIAMGNYFASTSPDSFFTRMRVATMPLPDGRVSLTDFELKISRAGREDVLQLPDNEAYLSALDEYFGIQLDAAYTDLKPIKKPA